MWGTLYYGQKKAGAGAPARAASSPFKMTDDSFPDQYFDVVRSDLCLHNISTVRLKVEQDQLVRVFE
jgi:hypothetical protein